MVGQRAPVPGGKITRLRVELTDEVSDKPFMELSVHGKWCEPDVIPNMYNAGFEILDLSREDAKITRQIIEEFGFRDNKPVKQK